MTETFDGVSIAEQDKERCIVLLHLAAMETKKGLTSNFEPVNTDLPSPVCTDEVVEVTATVNVEGNPVTYKWEKTHGGKIAECVIEPGLQLLKVTFDQV